MEYKYGSHALDKYFTMEQVQNVAKEKEISFYAALEMARDFIDDFLFNMREQEWETQQSLKQY